MSANKILHPGLDRTPGTDLLWSWEDLPLAPQAFFVLRRVEIDGSIPQELDSAELVEVSRLLDIVNEAIGFGSVEPTGIQLIDPDVAEREGIRLVAAEGLILFVIAVGAVAMRCAAEGWTEDQFESAVIESALMDEWKEWKEADDSYEPWFYLKYALRKVGRWPWIEGWQPFPKGTVIHIDGQTLALVPVKQHSDHVYFAFTRNDWEVLRSFKKRWRRGTLEKVASFSVIRSHNGYWSYGEKAGETVSEWKVAKASLVGSAFDLWKERTSS